MEIFKRFLRFGARLRLRLVSPLRSATIKGSLFKVWRKPKHSFDCIVYSEEIWFLISDFFGSFFCSYSFLIKKNNNKQLDVTCVITVNQTDTFDVTNCVWPRLVHECMLWWLVFRFAIDWALIYKNQPVWVLSSFDRQHIYYYFFFFPAWIIMTVITCLSFNPD